MAERGFVKLHDCAATGRNCGSVVARNLIKRRVNRTDIDEIRMEAQTAFGVPDHDAAIALVEHVLQQRNRRYVILGKAIALQEPGQFPVRV